METSSLCVHSNHCVCNICLAHVNSVVLLLFYFLMKYKFFDNAGVIITLFC